MNKFKKYDDQKKIVFYEKEDRHAKFLIRLHYDNIKQGEFFRAIMNGYVEGNEDLFNFLQSYKLNNAKSKRQISIVAKEKIRSNDIGRSFSILSDEEKESIFDILEEERDSL